MPKAWASLVMVCHVSNMPSPDNDQRNSSRQMLSIIPSLISSLLIAWPGSVGGVSDKGVVTGRFENVLILISNCNIFREPVTNFVMWSLGWGDRCVLIDDRMIDYSGLLWRDSYGSVTPWSLVFVNKDICILCYFRNKMAGNESFKISYLSSR